MPVAAGASERFCLLPGCCLVFDFSDEPGVRVCACVCAARSALVLSDESMCTPFSWEVLSLASWNKAINPWNIHAA
jgi:hypothetical protein